MLQKLQKELLKAILMNQAEPILLKMHYTYDEPI